MKRVFINSTLSTSIARKFNAELASLVRSESFDVFLPQEMLPPNSGLSSIKILEENERAIEQCDIMISVLDYSPGLGVAYELGYAKAKGKIIITYRSDSETSLGEILEGFWGSVDESRKAHNLSRITDILRDLKRVIC